MDDRSSKSFTGFGPWSTTAQVWLLPKTRTLKPFFPLDFFLEKKKKIFCYTTIPLLSCTVGLIKLWSVSTGSIRLQVETMKLKKQKRHRRAVRFFTVCFGFHQPYKVLCDGTFVHHLIANGIVPADKALSNILGGPVKLFTTRCVHAELKRLGSSYSESLQAAHKLMTARCDHDNKKSAEACITEIIGENNPEHFFVATQDTELRKKFQEVQGVPLIFGLRNALFLEQPSAFQREFAKLSEEKRLHMAEKEFDLLKKRAQDFLANEETGDSSDKEEDKEDENLVQQPVKKKQKLQNGMGVKDRPQFKRKKAKGPNPLSCKKKKKREDEKSSSKKESEAGSGSARSRSRKKRKRSHAGKLSETVSNVI